MRKSSSAELADFARCIKAYLKIIKLDPDVIYSEKAEGDDIERELINGAEDPWTGLIGPIHSVNEIGGYDTSSHQTKDDILFEYFAGWAYAHADTYRRFSAVVTSPRKMSQKFCHVCSLFYTPIF